PVATIPSNDRVTPQYPVIVVDGATLAIYQVSSGDWCWAYAGAEGGGGGSCAVGPLPGGNQDIFGLAGSGGGTRLGQPVPGALYGGVPGRGDGLAREVDAPV